MQHHGEDTIPLFPYGGSVRERLTHLVRFAILAPSGHNTQPWRFRVGDHTLEVLADRTRALPVLDPRDRALTISCGAALEHLLIAGRCFGLGLDTEILPGDDPDLLASVSIAGAAAPGVSDIAMFQAMPMRRTTRRKYSAQRLPDILCDACCQRAAGHDTALALIADDAGRARIADLVVEGNRIQFGDPAFRRELSQWVRSRRAPSSDGLSGSGFGIPDILSPVGSMMIRTFDMGAGVAASDRGKIMSGSPLLAVMLSGGDEPTDWLATGQALSRVLLTLTAAGGTAAFLNQPIEVPQLRPRLQAAIGTAHVPQLLLRIGYAPPPPRAPRRPLEEVLIAA